MTDPISLEDLAEAQVRTAMAHMSTHLTAIARHTEEEVVKGLLFCLASEGNIASMRLAAERGGGGERITGLVEEWAMIIAMFKEALEKRQGELGIKVEVMTQEELMARLTREGEPE